MMLKVFISGSMRIKNLDNNVLGRINNIIESNYQIIIGDANGVDRSIQEYLFKKNAESVIVYCSGERPRNNVGLWEVKKIETNAPLETRSFFTAKDIKLAEHCDYGLMIWDTKSTGTLSNVIELLKRKKMSLVYINKTKNFIKIKKVGDLENLISYMATSSFEKADKKINLNKQINSLLYIQSSMF